MRGVRHLRAPGSVEADLSRALRAAASRPGERRHRIRRRGARPPREEHGLRQRDLRRGYARDASRHDRNRPHPLLDRRREQALERAADPHRLRARPGRHLPQRQHRQRERDPRAAGARRIDLPDQQRHRSRPASLCPLAGRIDRGRDRRVDHAADRRVLVRDDHQGRA